MREAKERLDGLPPCAPAFFEAAVREARAEGRVRGAAEQGRERPGGKRGRRPRLFTYGIIAAPGFRGDRRARSPG